MEDNIIMTTEDLTSKSWNEKKWLWVIKNKYKCNNVIII